MNLLIIIILTLFFYSLISTIIYFFISGQNDDVLEFFGIGIIGWIILLLFEIIKPIYKYFKSCNKRSIFKDETGNLYKCKLKYTNDLMWHSSYKIVKRYAPKPEWHNIPDVPANIIEESKKNCDNCKHDAKCICDFPYDKVKCKHDQYGTVIEFDKFERK